MNEQVIKKRNPNNNWTVYKQLLTIKAHMLIKQLMPGHLQRVSLFL